MSALEAIRAGFGVGLSTLGAAFVAMSAFAGGYFGFEQHSPSVLVIGSTVEGIGQYTLLLVPVRLVAGAILLATGLRALPREA